jgi:hypothetical protein
MCVRVTVGLVIVLVLSLAVVLRLENRLVGTAVDKDIHLGSGDSVPLDAAAGERGIEAEGFSHRLQLVKRDSGVDGRAEEHVAANSGETIEIGNAHCRSEGLWPEL